MKVLASLLVLLSMSSTVFADAPHLIGKEIMPEFAHNIFFAVNGIQDPATKEYKSYETYAHLFTMAKPTNHYNDKVPVYMAISQDDGQSLVLDLGIKRISADLDDMIGNCANLRGGDEQKDQVIILTEVNDKTLDLYVLTDLDYNTQAEIYSQICRKTHHETATVKELVPTAKPALSLQRK